MNDCVICKLADHQIPSWIIYQDELVFCFLPLEVETFGHTVIAPKAHCIDLFSAPIEVLSGILPVIQKLTLHYRESIGATGVNLLHASGVAAQQSVPHLHFHLIPRFDDDGLNAWPNFSEARYDKDELLKMLRI